MEPFIEFRVITQYLVILTVIISHFDNIEKSNIILKLVNNNDLRYNVYKILYFIHVN